MADKTPPKTARLRRRLQRIETLPAADQRAVLKLADALVGKTRRGKGTKLMAIADGTGLPLAVTLASASPHEVTLVEPTLDAVCTTGQPERGGIGDGAYDSDALDARLRTERGVEFIACDPRRKMGAPCAAIGAGGRSSGSLPGCRTSAASSPGGNITPPTSSALSTWDASSSCSGIHETASSHPTKEHNRTTGVSYRTHKGYENTPSC